MTNIKTAVLAAIGTIGAALPLFLEGGQAP